MNTGTWEGNPLGYTTVEMLLDDVSKQMATSNLTRYSRGANGQKAGGSMRIAKPSSASNSPRGSIGLGRRRTVMSDGAYRRRLAMLEQQNAMANGGFVSNDGLQIPSRSTRPVSWHPASHLSPQQQYQQYQSTYSAPQQDANQFQMFDVLSNQAVYSGYASPSSTFSPLSMPFTGYEQPQYLYQDQTPSSHSNSSYAMSHQQHHQFQEHSSHTFVPQTSSNTDPTMYSHFDWNNFATNGFENSSTAPPTPENFLPIQHPEPSFPAEDSIPYHPLSEPDSDGEELIGMGLYDAPEVAKTPSSNPELDNYRALMMTGFLGTGYGKAESTGKGLKLEETWNPPPSDDEDEEDDDEQDGEAEDDDEPPAMPQPVVATVPQHHVVQTQTNFATQGYGGPGWL